MEKLKINFVDFWPNFKKNDNYFFHLLSQEYKVIIEEDGEPDILFHSYDYGNVKGHRRYDNFKNTKKVYYTGECSRPNFNESHFAFTFDYSGDDRNYRLPLWAILINWFNVPFDNDRDQSYLHDPYLMLNKNLIRYEKTKFCSFVSSNPGTFPGCSLGIRLDFVPKLHSRKFVNCAGKLYTNTPPIIGRGDQIHKINFLKDYKFNISFESTSNDGYVTEKIIHPMFVNTIPIYWGSKRVGDDFNKKSFLCYHDYENENDFLDKIMEVDDNNDLYESILSEPWFIDNKFPEAIQPRSVLKYFNEKILK